MFEDVHSEVRAKATPREGVSHLLRRVLNRIEDRLNANDWNGARALIEDARGRADTFADAVMHKGEGEDRAAVADAAPDPQAVREEGQRLSQGAVSGVVGSETIDQGEGGDTGEGRAAGPRRVGGGWVG